MHACTPTLCQNGIWKGRVVSMENGMGNASGGAPIKVPELYSFMPVWELEIVSYSHRVFCHLSVSLIDTYNIHDVVCIHSSSESGGHSDMLSYNRYCPGACGSFDCLLMLSIKAAPPPPPSLSRTVQRCTIASLDQGVQSASRRVFMGRWRIKQWHLQPGNE